MIEREAYSPGPYSVLNEAILGLEFDDGAEKPYWLLRQ